MILEDTSSGSLEPFSPFSILLGWQYICGIGCTKSIAYDVNLLASVILGMISGIFGGVIRDTLLNEIPLIFRKEMYATLFIRVLHYL